ncbi:type 1 glutamine amidotransferase domain-containing protein [Streptomyces sp. NPDC004393]|uniref:type 1 glutamine amidotransferase domain-containing protein n=1 Tax=Streptomyces sp. NPDC004533 TaxID=3154278 RepID=UPI0033A90CF7
MALTSHAQLGETGRTTGFHLPQAAHPWKIFTDAGYAVDLVSPRGGRPPMGGADVTDSVQMAFLDDVPVSEQLANTRRPAEVTPSDYEAILFVGGHGAMWDLPGDAALARLTRDVYEGGGVVAAVSHGAAALVDVRLSDNSRLIDGKRLTAFTNAEEEAVGLTAVMPFLLKSRLEERGGRHTAVSRFEANVVVDGCLVTGQNPASAAGVGRATVAVLSQLSGWAAV